MCDRLFELLILWDCGESLFFCGARFRSREMESNNGAYMQPQDLRTNLFEEGGNDATLATSQDVPRVRRSYNDRGPKMKALEAREGKEKSPSDQEVLDAGVGLVQ
ncbi:unnamed protein product [Linum trigynum]|uniref:Uncharacterized protein n=1 Tax=Linum trigynum TaxID=586398 RepID=A0AAV2E428_9ROSI